ncbi:ferrous iron transport protein B [Rhodobacter veldkampii DSM 11550]|uniref:Ferrous iron transport protein B n=1 Tax=Phaeovulum veldkampii DSM 11550 TaxID=1185920 RepID=A0A2T4JIS5_9RHOB|nr:ferrous iron transport protein B [Phaeovulum veldkampii]MBK5947493.1 ferrous iron transport protein B [Phaeovulum veldkampii DSM 11550]PTE17795.1 ferrous iron transport protein B [Phaeovulum veldkampii DSM 11550]TDQ63340.1 ferrous iron transport protein B [Phaeovulum veldkampii DSM 11550]
MNTPDRPATLHVALAGQQNAGKSTLFNLLTGMAQHVANYPGVTVDKKTGSYRDGATRVEVVDLPGTYSLTAFSLEERVARSYLLAEAPDVVVNVLDASNLRRGLYLTFQLLELGFPTIIVLNMMDMAARRGLEIDLAALETRLCVPVVPVIGRKGEGAEALRAAILGAAAAPRRGGASLNYGLLEPAVAEIQAALADQPALAGLSARWLAVKLLEQDAEAERLLTDRLPDTPDLLARAQQARAAHEARHGRSAGDTISAARDQLAGEIVATCITDTKAGHVPLSERIDRFLLNRWLAPLFLTASIWVIYQLSIVQGYELTKVTWPFLAGLRNLAADLLPDAGFLYDPQSRALGLWLVDSANTLLNYVPIFLILFALIAMLEDSGYMARIAFILDRVLHRFGLHGQSTLPFILAGVFAGGCAVPGVMATKGIPDHRARMATILTVPFMNCMAKIPLYTLLINIYFPQSKGLMLFYLSTITVIAALLVAKLLTVSVLRKEETAPFVMELPHYHLPTVSGVLRRALDRTWMYIQKVGTTVLAIAVVIYFLLQFPGVAPDRQAQYQTRAETAITQFYAAMGENPHRTVVDDPARLVELVNVYTDYRAAKLNAQGQVASDKVDAKYLGAHPEFAPFLARGGDADTRAAGRALKQLADARKTLRREIRQEKIETSLLGQIGRGLEPVTQFADFDWKINVALLASFAARESSVATLGVLFEQDEGENTTLEQRMGAERADQGYTALTAVAIMLFFALYPPCLATVIMVRIQTDSYRWMAFSIVFPTILGLAVASAVFTLGTMLDLTGLQMMTAVYVTALGLLLVVGLPKPTLRRSPARGPQIRPQMEDRQ